MKLLSWLFVFAFAAGFAACRIEPTPQRYIDAQATPLESLRAAEADVRRGLEAIPDALRTGTSGAISLALAPHAELTLLRPGGSSYPASAGDLLREFQEFTRGDPVSLTDLAVTVSNNLTVAWFSTILRGSDPDGVDRGLTVSGVFIRQTGEWRLIQAHLSPLFTAQQP